MLITKVEKGNIEKALRQYKRKTIKTKQMKKLRDNQDINRKNSPLKIAPDSIVIKTDSFTLDELEEKLLSYITPKL